MLLVSDVIDVCSRLKVAAGMGNLDFLFPEEQNLQWDLGASTDVDGMLLP